MDANELALLRHIAKKSQHSRAPSIDFRPGSEIEGIINKFINCGYIQGTSHQFGMVVAITPEGLRYLRNQSESDE